MLTLMAALVIAAIGYSSSGSSKPLTSSLIAPSHPLRKLEPQALLTRTDLNLDAPQRGRLEAVDRAWQAEKLRYQQAMEGFRPKQGRVEQISANLAGYSELSRAYDAARQRYWSEATKVLNQGQLKLVDGGLR